MNTYICTYKFTGSSSLPGLAVSIVRIGLGWMIFTKILIINPELNFNMLITKHGPRKLKRRFVYFVVYEIFPAAKFKRAKPKSSVRNRKKLIPLVYQIVKGLVQTCFDSNFNIYVCSVGSVGKVR